jgi:hypothetical protein
MAFNCSFCWVPDSAKLAEVVFMSDLYCWIFFPHSQIE